MADDEKRDELLAGLLEVEPLDEVTRRRFVTTALRETAPAHPTGSGLLQSRRLAVAASIMVVVVGGLGVALLSSRGDDTVPSAQRSPASTAAPPALTPGQPEAQSRSTESGAADSASPTPPDLGEFGDLRDTENRERLRMAAGASFADTSGAADYRGVSLLERLEARSCASDLPEGTIVALGTGRIGEQDAIVVGIARDDGTISIHAVTADPCKVRPLD